MSERYSGIEDAIRSIWSEILGRSDIAANDNFFEIGGDAAKGQRLRAEIKRKFGSGISHEELCTNPTISAISVFIRSNTQGTIGETLVCLQEGTRGLRPLYCFPPVSGSPARYSRLVEHLDPRQPVFGLQSVGLLPGKQMDRTVEDMARRFCRDIMLNQSQSIPIFFGYSFGGLLAVEAAAEMSRHIAAPPALVIVDCEPESGSADPVRFGYHVLAKTVLRLSLDVEALLLMPRPEALRTIRDAAVRRGSLPRDFDLDRLQRIADVCQACQAAANAYRPRWVGGELAIFESREGTAAEAGLRWSKYFNHVDISPLEGDHLSLIDSADLTPIADWLTDLASR